METVISKDGTPIAYERTGKGPALVLVHGTSADHSRWAGLLPALNELFTVYAVDRRGRGGSGDSANYSIEREFEDVASVVNSIEGPVNLLGHSYGGICSLEAALLAPRLRRLILYEPPIPVGVPGVYPPEVIARIGAALSAGDRDRVVSTFLREIPRLPEQQVEQLRSFPAWQGRLAAAHTIPRELTASNGGYTWRPERFKNLRTPTLLLLGGDSPAFFGAAIEALHGALPQNRLVILPGQQHAAMDSARDLFTREVVRFLTEPQLSPAAA